MHRGPPFVLGSDSSQYELITLSQSGCCGLEREKDAVFHVDFGLCENIRRDLVDCDCVMRSRGTFSSYPSPKQRGQFCLGLHDNPLLVNNWLLASERNTNNTWITKSRKGMNDIQKRVSMFWPKFTFVWLVDKAYAIISGNSNVVDLTWQIHVIQKQFNFSNLFTEDKYVCLAVDAASSWCMILRFSPIYLSDIFAYCRDKYRFYACLLRARFDENKNEKDMIKATMMLKAGEEEFWTNQHPQPYIFPDSPGGTSYERYDCYKVGPYYSPGSYSICIILLK